MASSADILDLIVDLIATRAAEKVLAAQQGGANDSAPEPAASGKLLTADRLASRLGVSSDTIRRWARSSDIPKTNVAAPGKEPCWRYDLGAVQRWLATRGE